MFFPYNTDAPIYHWPFATGGLLVVCVLVTAAFLSVGPEAESLFLLEYDRINPLQWVTSLFAHIDLFHLIGNAFGLWAFGLIVEGKVGWWKTLLLFLGIGILQSGVEQIMMVAGGGRPGGSLGASAAIYGLMTVAMIWAPLNNLSCILFLRFRAFTFETPIAVFVAIYVGLDLLIAYVSGFGISSSVLHLMGAVLGLVAGLAFLKLSWVDCENWDLFSVLAGRHRRAPDDGLGRWKEEQAVPQKTPEERYRHRETALAQIRQITQEGNPALAYQAHLRMKREDREWELPARDFLRVLEAFQKQKQGSEALPALQEFIRTYPDQADLVRLVAARVLIHEAKRPGQARKVLQRVNPSGLNDSQRRAYEQLLAKAEKLFQDDPYEVTEDWEYHARP